MAASHRATSSPPRLPRAPRGIAIAASIGLHLALLGLLPFVLPLPGEVEQRERTQVVWLQDRLDEPVWSEATLRPDEATVPRQEAPVTPEEVPVGTEAEPVVPEEAPAVPEEAPAIPEEAPIIPEEAPMVSREAPDSILPAPEVEQREEALPGGLDLEAARQRVRERARAERQEPGHLTFAIGDSDAAASGDVANPYAQLFEGGSSGNPRRAALVPQRSRTRVGRAIAELCNALTGGVSVMGLMSVCASQSEGRTAFYAIRPDYLKKLPYCYDVPLETDFSQDAEGLATATKCVLVTEEERTLVEQYGVNALPRGVR